ncbi:MAG: hypothetical protein ACLQVF_19575 [Isosphaeraceae bacterium]
MHRMDVCRILAPLLVLAISPRVRGDDGQRDLAPGTRAAAWTDVTPRRVQWIKPGTQIGDAPPQGWSHLVLLAKPRIGVGDVDAIPKAAIHFGSMFSFTVLANVRTEGKGDAEEKRYFLEHVAIGMATNVQGRNLIVTSDQTFGADVGIIGRAVMRENDRILSSDMRQVARTRTMHVFDVNAIMLRTNQHRQMVIRHVILVAPLTGQLTAFVWLLGRDGTDQYTLADNAIQMLPPQMHEDRVLSVDARKFTFGIPAADAFALARLPQGTPVKYSKSLIMLAALRRFTPETALQLEDELQTRYAPLALRVNQGKSARR